MTGTVLLVFSFFLGAIVGSFLNACIHRLPRDISLRLPRRSFCPACNQTIPWTQNLPIVSWLALRGKCAKCGARIPVRYFLVEVITAGLFVACAHWFQGPAIFVYWIFIALLIAATFIDFEHLIIPDEITIGGTVAGLVFCAAFPGLMGETTLLRGLGFSLAGAVVGFVLLWLVVEGGKLAFGKKRHRFAEAENFSIPISEDKAVLMLGQEGIPWEDIFSRESDELVLECPEYRIITRSANAAAQIEKKGSPSVSLRIRHDCLFCDAEKIPLSDIAEIHGRVISLTMPREAMGFGDVKFMAMIGAFLGFKAVLFTIFAAALVGAVVGVTMLLVTKGKQGGRIPFGPYLAVGALLWIFSGTVIMNWYLDLLSNRPH